jgi:hypothetical protein
MTSSLATAQTMIPATKRNEQVAELARQAATPVGRGLQVAEHPLGVEIEVQPPHSRRAYRPDPRRHRDAPP